MTLTPEFCTGFEHGVASLVVTGGGIARALNGTPTIESGQDRNGGYALRLNPAGGATGESIQAPNHPATGVRRVAMRFWIRFVTKPTANANLAYLADASGTAIFRFNNASNRFSIQVGGNTDVDISDLGAPSTGVWYLVDLYFNANGATADFRGRVNLGTTYQNTRVQAAADIGNVNLGTATSHTYDAYYDDWLVGSSNSDTPEFWGGGRVVALKPTADGSHNAGTNVIEVDGGGDVGANSAWDRLDEVPISDTTNYIQQAATGTGNYAEVAFGDLPAGAARINCVRAVMMYGSSGTNANSGEARIRRGDGTPADVLGLGAPGLLGTDAQTTAIGTAWDMSETAPVYKGALVPLTAGGSVSGWDKTTIDALLARVGFSGDANPLPRWYNLILEVDYAETDVSVGQIAETDSVPAALTGQKPVPVGQPSEADTADTITRQSGHQVTVNQTAETDTVPGVLSGRKSKAVAQATETDTVPGVLVGQKRAVVSQALESESAQPLSHYRTGSVGQALEADSALAVSGRKSRALAQTAETDTAGSASPRKQAAVAQALETDSALALAGRKSRAVAQALETDAALALGGQKRGALGQALETDTAGSLSHYRSALVGLALEADSALAVSGRKARALGQASESDVALAIAAVRRLTLGQVTEVDEALVVTPHQGNPATFVDVNTALETDSALALSGRKLRAVNQALETDSAMSLPPRKAAALGQALEADVALAIDHMRRRLLGLAAETDAALAIAPSRLVLIGLAAESDSASAIDHRRLALIGQAVETDVALAISRTAIHTMEQAVEVDTAGRIWVALPPGGLVLATSEAGDLIAVAVVAPGTATGYAAPVGGLVVTAEEAT